ncbi:protein-S-isoprenylcysteine O-methyltransferase [Staphylotrichum tortipilum]|uniref:Protein-S-isoprenylcysteine O-methyltransferase n=1 Tax=Staphylotrichum tortipilum TaxID=2831512 RepID=A0AAN6MFL0_9PEZI|nr:protein-S-isoprenylcysteine O-methyltransferase [Staphylotrichum longicolle]
METPSRIRRDTPAEYTVPPFPSLFWPPQASKVILYELDEMWKFTLFWTIILYGLFHLGAVGVAVLMQGGRRMSSWKNLWLVPLTYALIAGFEGLLAGTLVGLIQPAASARAISSATSTCRPGSPLSGAGSTSWSWSCRRSASRVPKSLAGIATRAFCLGITLAASTTAALTILLFTTSPLWRLPFFAATLSLFHFFEFWTTAAYNTRAAEVSSFLLTANWPSYVIAHTFASLECLVTHVFWPSARWAPAGLGPALTLAGFALVVLGQTVRSVAMIHAGRSFNHLVQYRRKKGHVLVTSGVYSVLRHPSYFGFFWWALGSQMVMGNVVSFVGYAAVLWKFFSSRIGTEEEYLVAFFGEEYVLYRKRVRTMIPFVR